MTDRAGSKDRAAPQIPGKRVSPIAKPVTWLPFDGSSLTVRVGLVASVLLLFPAVLLVIMYQAANTVLDEERLQIDLDHLTSRAVLALEQQLDSITSDTLILQDDISCRAFGIENANAVCTALRTADLQRGAQVIDVGDYDLNILASPITTPDFNGYAIEIGSDYLTLRAELRGVAFRAVILLLIVDLMTLILYLRHEFGALSAIVSMLREYQHGNLETQPNYLTTSREVTNLHKSLQDFRNWVEARKKASQIEMQLNMAVEMQNSVAPPDLSSAHAQVFGETEPAMNVGGDFFDYFWIRDDMIAFIVADVSDKGIGSAFFGLQTAALIRAYAETEHDPARVLTLVNKQISERNSVMMFTTAYLCFVDLTTGHVQSANAGHEPMFLIKDGNARTVHFDADENGQPPLGLFDDFVYSARDWDLDVGDTLFLYTDGANEARAPSGEFFGRDRLIELAQNTLHSEADLQKSLSAIKGNVKEFCAPNAPGDDLTFLAFRLLGLDNKRSLDAVRRRA